MSVANASQHLQVLRAAHLVEVRREGVSMYYSLTDEGVFRMWQALRAVGEAQFAEIDRVVLSFLQDRARLQPMGAQDLLHHLGNDQIILLEYDESDRLSWILSRNEDQTYAVEVRVRHAF